MILLYLIGAVTAILFLKFYLYKRRIMKYVAHLPSPPEIPIFGSGLYFLGKNSVEIMDMLCMTTGMFETPCRFWLGPVLSIILGKPEDFQVVLLSPKCLEKPYMYRFLDDGDGLFTSPVHEWKPQRKLLNPTFNNKILQSFLPIFNEKSQILTTILSDRVGQKAFNVSKQIFACTLEMVCSTTIGCNLEFQSNKNVEMLETMEMQSELVANRIIKFWLHPLFVYKFTQGYRDYQRNAECIYKIPREIRKMKEKEFYESKYFEQKEELKEDEFFTTPQIFVNELFKLHSQKLLDDRFLDGQILAILVAEKAFQEVKDAHETQTSYTDAEIIAKLGYLEMCIKETMRLFPIAPFSGRQTVEDVKLSHCTVPKGTILMLSFHHLHRDKNVWGANSEVFDPDNFLPEKVAARHAFSYLPFSAGSRNCIGIKYAWLTMKIMLSAIMRQYKFSTHLRLEDIVTKFEVTLKLENRHMITIERREKY